MTTPVEIVKVAGELHDKNHEFKDAFAKFLKIVHDYAEEHQEDFTPMWMEFLILVTDQATNFMENICDFTKAVAIEGVRDERAKNAGNN